MAHFVSRRAVVLYKHSTPAFPARASILNRAKLNLVMGADPLYGPRTGIENYTRELLNALLNIDDINNIQLHGFGRLMPANTNTLELDEPPSGRNVKALSRRGSFYNASIAALRTKLSKSAVAHFAYKKLEPIMSSIALKSLGGAYLYHSPNFFLPQFSGPTITTFHDLSIIRFPDFHPLERVRFMEAKIKQASESDAHVICPSELVRYECETILGIDRQRLSVIPHGVDPSFRPRSADECRSVLNSHHLDYGRFLLFVSTVEPRKNILNICKAIHLANSSGDFNWPVVFIGHPGWRSTDEHAAIQDLCAKGRAKYLGFAPAHELRILMSAAGGLLYPSIYEGFGMPAAEAQRSGTAVITSQHSSMAEFTCDTDLLVNPDNAGDISDAIVKLSQRSYKSEHTGGRMGENASRLTWRASALAHLDAYRRAADGD